MPVQLTLERERRCTVLAIQKKAYESGWADGYCRTPNRAVWIEEGTVREYDDGYDDGASATPKHPHIARLLQSDFLEGRKSA